MRHCIATARVESPVPASGAANPCGRSSGFRIQLTIDQSASHPADAFPRISAPMRPVLNFSLTLTLASVACAGFRQNGMTPVSTRQGTAPKPGQRRATRGQLRPFSDAPPRAHTGHSCGDVMSTESRAGTEAEGHVRMRHFAGRLSALAIAGALLCPPSAPAHAWGDEGHEVIAWIARSFLDPAVRQTVDALLAADPDPLTEHNFAAAATWADRYREADINGARQATRQWHFVDIERTAPDLDRACFGHARTPGGTPASNGPPRACVVDKIEEFAAELANPATDAGERIVALKFLLHLVGDEHQPLHASDDHDRGGNDKRASAPGIRAGTLHHYWDTEFVEDLGPNPKQIAASLAARISQGDASAWARGGPADWAMETFRIAIDDAYGQLPEPNERGSFRLPPAYMAMARRDVAIQLSKAGVRVAVLLNRAFGQRPR